MNAFWFVMVIVGLLTFITRLTFILLEDKWQPPELVTRGLRFVPVAVLTAIYVPEILLVEDQIALSLANPRLLAGIIAILVAYKTKSALWTIGIGMAVFWFLGWII